MPMSDHHDDHDDHDDNDDHDDHDGDIRSSGMDAVSAVMTSPPDTAKLICDYSVCLDCGSPLGPHRIGVTVCEGCAGGGPA